MILYAAADLLWATRIKRTADALGLAARPARDIRTLDERLGDSVVSALIVDLDAEDSAMELIGHLRRPDAPESAAAVRVVAFGPHVRTDLFDQARAAGADDVVTRGQLDRQMPEILRELAGGKDRQPPG
jgi:hypothetical protein